MFKKCGMVALVLVLVMAGSTSQAAIPWTSEGVIPGLQVRYGALGAAWHEDALHIVSLTRDNTQHSWWQDGQWTGPTTAAGLHCGLVPVIASDGQTLHLLTEMSGKKIGYSRWDGRAWSNTEPIDGLGTNKALEMAIGDGTIHLVHCGKNSDAKRLWHASQSGWGWSSGDQIPDQNTHIAPGLAVWEGALHQVHVGSSSKTLWHSFKTPWGEWSPRVQVPGAMSSRRPTLVVANKRLYLFFTQGDLSMNQQAPVAYCVYEDGQWTAPEVIEGYVSYGKVQVAVQKGLLPEQFHLLLPLGNGGVLHLRSELELKMAPLKVQAKTIRR